MIKSYGDSIVNRYAKADASGRVDIICSHYAVFIGIIESSVDGLVFLIEDEKINARRAEKLALGVRVQSSGYSDPTGNTVAGEDEIRRAIIECDFSGGVLEESSTTAFMMDAATLFS